MAAERGVDLLVCGSAGTAQCGGGRSQRSTAKNHGAEQMTKLQLISGNRP